MPLTPAQGKALLKDVARSSNAAYKMRCLMLRYLRTEYGERCTVFCPGCANCEAWAAFDILFSTAEPGMDVTPGSKFTHKSQCRDCKHPKARCQCHAICDSCIPH